MEVRGHVELRTTFSNGASSRTINIMYIVVNVVLAYNLLLGRPSLNRLGAGASTSHMKMKLPSLEGGEVQTRCVTRSRVTRQDSWSNIQAYGCFCLVILGHSRDRPRLPVP